MSVIQTSATYYRRLSEARSLNEIGRDSNRNSRMTIACRRHVGEAKI